MIHLSVGIKGDWVSGGTLAEVCRQMNPIAVPGVTNGVDLSLLRIFALKTEQGTNSPRIRWQYWI
jgi:hypothetical protein